MLFSDDPQLGGKYAAICFGIMAWVEHCMRLHGVGFPLIEPIVDPLVA